MRFYPTDLDGVVVIEREPRRDERGWFTRAFCERELRDAGLSGVMAQSNLSFSRERGTLRGMHFQAHPHAEAKTVLVMRGAIFDVALDVRPGSRTYLRWTAVELREGDDRALHLSSGFAHGFLTLEPDTLVQYFVSSPYTPAAERTVRWDEPKAAIAWPFAPSVVSAKDAAAPHLTEGPPPWSSSGESLG
jgi:dTDP-4-dehydrorhamnose 3,5-epimerase